MRLALALLLLFSLARSFAGHVPGTSTSLNPPPDFVPAKRFPGFMLQQAGASIMVNEIPGPFNEVISGFEREEALAQQGLTLIEQSGVQLQQHPGKLYRMEQIVDGTPFSKWILAVDRKEATTLLVATHPKVLTAQLSLPLKRALLSATFGKPGDSSNALAYTVEPAEPFASAKIMGQTMIMSVGGKFPLTDENEPFIAVGLSATKDQALEDKDRKALAEKNFKNNLSANQMVVESCEPITIGPLSGFVTIGHGTGTREDIPITVYDVVLFDEDGYALIQGATPTAKKDVYLPIFEKIARSYRLK